MFWQLFNLFAVAERMHQFPTVCFNSCGVLHIGLGDNYKLLNLCMYKHWMLK